MIASPSELQYFLEVGLTLNLSRAAERLGISQPSLSVAIKRLEQSVGTTLLIRHKKGVTLTQAGKQLLLHTRKLLQQWQEVKSQALASHSEVQGCFTIGCHPSIAKYSLPFFLPELMNTHSNLEIKLKHDISRKITEEVIDLSVDIGLVVNPVKHPDLIIRKLFNDEVGFWQKKNSQVQLSKPSNKVVLCDPELQQTQSLLKKAKKQGIVFDRIIPTNSLELIAALTAKGCGVGVLPTRVMLTSFPDKLSLIRGAPTYFDEVCMVYRSEHRDVTALQTIIAAIKNFAVNAQKK